MSKWYREFKQVRKDENRCHPQMVTPRKKMTLKSYRQQRRLWGGRWRRKDRKESNDIWSRSVVWRLCIEEEEE